MLKTLFRFTVLGVLGVLLNGCVTTTTKAPPTQPTTPSVPQVRYEPVDWNHVGGWQTDSVQDAWSAFLNSCRAIGQRPEWASVCAEATGAASPRAFFESRFTPYRIVQRDGSHVVSETGMITGYYEPVLRGARKPSAAFPVPLYAPPDDLLTIELGDLYPELKGKRVRGRLQGKKVVPYFTRGELATQPVLKGKEIVWVDNAVDAFFLEVQGSGRVQFSDGSTIRVAYADQNGQPYRSIGRYLVDLGEMTLDQASAQEIRRWVISHPERKQEVLNVNPSVVFFREERIDDPLIGPKGALGVPLTAGRSLAVDPQFIPLGAPVFLDTTQPNSTVPLQRLLIAQDTGGAIRGVNRGDLFWGTGNAAGELAGRMKQQGRMWLLLPKNMPPPAPR
jgi:membrane-bound lytic murein transglycosylase A